MIHIISPHIDDAMLSLGGYLLNLRKENKSFNIIYVFSSSQWTNSEAISGLKYPAEVNTVTALRIEEEISIAKQLKYDFQLMEFPDLPLRNENTKDQERLVSTEIKNQLLEIFSNDDELFFPAGLEHHDHKIVHEIGLQFLAEGYRVNFYEDLPYAAMSNSISHQFNTLRERNYEPMVLSIDMEAKVEILKHYSSQMSVKWLSYVKAYAYNLTNSNYYERYWKRCN